MKKAHFENSMEDTVNCCQMSQGTTPFTGENTRYVYQSHLPQNSGFGYIETSEAEMTGTLGTTNKQLKLNSGPQFNYNASMQSQYSNNFDLSMSIGEHSKQYLRHQIKQQKDQQPPPEVESFLQMQSDIQRLQDKIRGLESKLSPPIQVDTSMTSPSPQARKSGSRSRKRLEKNTAPSEAMLIRSSNESKIEAASNLLQQKHGNYAPN